MLWVLPIVRFALKIVDSRFRGNDGGGKLLILFNNQFHYMAIESLT